ncbi:MAG TPA: tetratricopeptide repeat protein [Pyrinomonadaceae bacterium]
MTKIQRYCYCALGLLAILNISTGASLAQRNMESGSPTTPTIASSAIRNPSWRTESTGDVLQIPVDPFSVLPASDALIMLDLKRFSSDVVPRLLIGEQDARALVIALADPKTIELLDPRAVQRAVVGFRYSKSQAEKSSSDFEVVTVAQSSEAGQLPTLIRTRGSGKYREQSYAGKILYIIKLEQTEPKVEATTGTSSDETEWAIVALDANTLVFGSPAYVRSSIDLNTGKGTTVSAELVTAVKRNSKALVSAAGMLPPSLMSAAQQSVNSELSHVLSSLKQFYASVEPTPTGFEVAVTLNTTSPEQTKNLVDLFGAFKTLAVSLAPGKTRQDKVARELIKGLVISAGGTEVQIKDQITQVSVNELTKQIAARIYFSRGLDQVQKGDSEAAITEYDKAIILDPDNANAFINRGKARANKGTLDAAIADYDKALSLDPDSALTYNNRCFALVNKGNFDAAIVDCDRAIALDPTFAFPYNNRGLAFASQGKLDKAIPDYDKSIALDGENIFAYQNRGDARIQIGNWDGAIADFEKCITLNTNSAEAYNGRGLARYYKGELDQALADYNKTLSLNPDLAITYNNRALALVGKGNLDQAMADYDKSIALDDKNDLVYSNRGHLRNQKEDWNGAISDFDKAIALNPKSANAYNGRGLTRFSKKESDQAIADFDKAIALNPIASFYLNRGYARNEKSDYDGAIADFDKAISLSPESADSYNGRGLAHYYKVHFDQAIADYDKAIAIAPDFAEVYGNRALCLLALRRDAQAEQDLKKCFELNELLRPVYDPLVKEIKKTRRLKPRN